jgi:hypothetical protein
MATEAQQAVAKKFPNGWFIEKTVTRKGKTYKQWFRTKDPNAVTAKVAKAKNAPTSGLSAAPPSSTAPAGPAQSSAQKLMGAKRAIVAASPQTHAEKLMLHKSGSQLGSNEGGTYVGADGKSRYIKFYKNPLQAASEKLTLQIYKDLGHGVPHAELIEHGGKKGIASELIEGKKLDKHLKEGSPESIKEASRDFLKGFTTDVLTANWDAAGLTHDNALVGGDGRVSRIDVGGALLRRAQGAPKPEHMLKDIKEWEGFFDPKVNPSYSQLAQKAGVKKAEDLGDQLHKDIAGIQKLEKKFGGWDGYVAKHAPELAKNPEEFRKTVDMLTARTKLLAERIEKVPPGDPGAGYKYVQREVTAKGKTYKRWFKVKDKEAVELAKANKLRKFAPKKTLTRDEKQFEIAKAMASLPSAQAERKKLFDDDFHEMLESTTKIYKSLPPAQRDALLAFTGSAYRTMRAVQAGKFDGHKHWTAKEKEQWIQKVKDLEAGQHALTIPEPTKRGPLHRGFNVTQDDLHEMLNGHSITHDGYSTNSTSYDRGISEGFLRKQYDTDDGDMKYPVMLVYTKVKQGASFMHHSNGSKDEQEVALGKGTFRITGKRYVTAATSNSSAVRYFEFTVEEVDD